MTGALQQDISQGKRFSFGANWRSFLETLDEDRILEAQNSLTGLLRVDDLVGRRFLDIGCGSGLFSLAARRLGAHVHSFDFDAESVQCALTLKNRYFPGDDCWVIEENSALDRAYLSSLGKYDIVYSWGVLHHTGDMWTALELAMMPVAAGGSLFIAIYNDQGFWSTIWRKVKTLYCSNRLGRVLVLTVFIPVFAIQAVIIGIAKHGNPAGHFISYRKNRGMSVYHDWVDWLGGLPFEVATPHDVVELYRANGFVLDNLVTTNRLGCNQYVFRKSS